MTPADFGLSSTLAKLAQGSDSDFQSVKRMKEKKFSGDYGTIIDDNRIVETGMSARLPLGPLQHKSGSLSKIKNKVPSSIGHDMMMFHTSTNLMMAGKTNQTTSAFFKRASGAKSSFQVMNETNRQPMMHGSDSDNLITDMHQSALSHRPDPERPSLSHILNQILAKDDSLSNFQDIKQPIRLQEAPTLHG